MLSGSLNVHLHSILVRLTVLFMTPVIIINVFISQDKRHSNKAVSRLFHNKYRLGQQTPDRHRGTKTPLHGVGVSKNSPRSAAALETMKNVKP